MSSEWATVPIGSLCLGIFDGPHATPKKAASGPVFLGISSLSRGQLERSAFEFLSEEDFERWTKRVTPQAGDVVFSYETRLGEAALIPEGLRCCLGRRMALMRIDRSKAAPEFVLYAFLAPAFQDVIRARTIHGSTVDRLPLLEFGSFPITLPPLRVQHGIVEVLRALDDRITLLRETNAMLEAIAQALFKSWFVDFDPVRAKMEGRAPEGMDEATAALFPDGFEESRLGPIPRGWTEASIYEVTQVIYGAPFASSKFNTEGIGRPLIRIRDLRDESPGVHTPEVHTKGYVVQAGDLVVGMDGEFRTYLWGGEEAWLNQRVCVFAPKAGVPVAFLRSVIAPQLAHIEATEAATTVIHLGKGDIDRFVTLLPGPEVLLAFAGVVDPLYARIVSNKQTARTLATLRDTLLPRLISGQLRLPDAEHALKEATP